ncbi:winged helix-turn-helix domain-containing protein [Streptomyces sp. NPDC002688]|uniref:winged helix-turn-helix domain-containing protein n=1 Tax=Streptomyces sp. NPDC002688 TaxID=3154423 RepID=UPI00331FDC38
MCRRGTALAKEAGPSQNDRPELEKGPTAHGCGEDQRWVPAGVIARRFHVRFSQAQTWRTLHQMGWMVQVSMRWAAEREDDVGATWIREAWPRAERRGRTRTRDCASRTFRQPDAPAAEIEHHTWCPRRRTPPRHGQGRGLGTHLARRPGLPQVGPAHPAGLPDAGAPRPQG